jgi:hypothetical protein
MLRMILAVASLGACSHPAPRVDAAFELELVAPRPRVALGEPAHLFAVLRNVSPREREVPDLLDPSYGFLHVRWRREGAGAGGDAPAAVPKESSWMPVVRREGRGRRPVELAPGATLEAAVPIYAGRDGWVLDQPGTYVVTAEFECDGGVVAAKPAKLEVFAPEGDDERRAAALLMEREATRFLQLGGGAPAGEGRARLEQLEREHAKSPLAAYAQLALALDDSRESFDPVAKGVRPARPEAAAERLGRALPRIGDPVLAVAGLETLVRSLRLLGRGDEAERTMREFRERRAKELERGGLAQRVDALAKEKDESPGK